MGYTPEQIREMEHMHRKMSYNRIEELIYAGNNMCCQGHFEEECNRSVNGGICSHPEAKPKDLLRKILRFTQNDNALPPLTDALPFLLSYFICKRGESLYEAIAILKGKRPSGHFNEA